MPPDLGWDYERFPNYKDLILQRSLELARELLRPKFDTVGRTSNTKGTHKKLFSGLTPDLQPGFAGNYRGSDLPELKFCSVGIRSDPRVGVPPEEVLSAIQALAKEIARGIAFLDNLKMFGTAIGSRRRKARRPETGSRSAQVPRPMEAGSPSDQAR